MLATHVISNWFHQKGYSQASKALDEVMQVGLVILLVECMLMISLLVAPAAAARQWTHHLGKMVGLASTIGAICAAGGALLSAVFSHLPTGPVIVALVTLAFVASVLCSPSRGLLFRRRFVVD